MHRPLTGQDYLLLLIVGTSVLAGVCTFIFVFIQIVREARGAAKRRHERVHHAAFTPHLLAQKNARSAYRVSVVRH